MDFKSAFRFHLKKMDIHLQIQESTSELYIISKYTLTCNDNNIIACITTTPSTLDRGRQDKMLGVAFNTCIFGKRGGLLLAGLLISMKNYCFPFTCLCLFVYFSC